MVERLKLSTTLTVTLGLQHVWWEEKTEKRRNAEFRTGLRRDRRSAL